MVATDGAVHEQGGTLVLRVIVDRAAVVPGVVAGKVAVFRGDVAPPVVGRATAAGG